MCLGIPGEIVSFDNEMPDLALADVSGVRRTINVALLEGEGLEVGDWVLIHVGFATVEDRRDRGAPPRSTCCS